MNNRKRYGVVRRLAVLVYFAEILALRARQRGNLILSQSLIMKRGRFMHIMEKLIEKGMM